MLTRGAPSNTRSL